MSNNKENKYGHLLDKFLDGSKKYTHPFLEKEEKAKKEEGKNRYGNLLDNVKPDHSIYDKILKIDENGRKHRQEEAEKERQMNIRRQERIERERQEMDERINRNDAFVNSYLEKKQAEQEAIRKANEEKRKEQAEQQELYNSIDRLMNISPKLADAFVEARAHTWK